MHWSGTPLKVKKEGDGFRITTPGRFQDIVVRKIRGAHTGRDYLAVADTSFVEIDKSKIPSQEARKLAEKEFPKLCGEYPHEEKAEWGLRFQIVADKNNPDNILLCCGEVGKELVPQSIIQVEENAILFNGHDRQPPDKIFRFVRASDTAPWRLQVLDYATKEIIEERSKS